MKSWQDPWSEQECNKTLRIPGYLSYLMKMVVPIPKRTMQLLCLLDPVWVAQRWVSLAGLACSRSGCAGAGQWHQGRRNKAVNTEALCWWGFLTAAAKQKPGSPFLNKFVIHPEVIVAFLRQCLLLSTKLHLNKDTWQRFWRQTRIKASILLYVQLLFDCAACLFFVFTEAYFSSLLVTVIQEAAKYLKGLHWWSESALYAPATQRMEVSTLHSWSAKQFPWLASVLP